MTDYWKQWEGQVIADAFPLRQYLGGDEDHAVFLTEYGQPAPQKAAIKIVPGSPEDTGSQLSQWHLASKLSHPNLLRIFSKGHARVGDTPLIYLVTEFADESLAQVIPVRPLTTDEAGQMLEPALSVLAYLHGEGFAHGHVKPANILAIGECLKISSARLCRIGECPPLTRDPTQDAYMPPEGTASPEGDVWSLGITLVEALTQHPPAYSAADPRDPVIPETLPQPFLDIARECLRIDPKARPTIAGISERLRPAETLPAKKRPALKWAYALAAAVGLVVAAVVIAPRLINHEQPVASSEPAEIPPAAPIEPPQSTPPAPAPPPRPAPPNEIIQRVLPEVSSGARRTIQGRVRVSVRVRVDASGKVAEAILDSPGPSKYFGQLALQASRRWKFAPAPDADPARPREWVLHFEFERTGTKVAPVRRAT